MIFNLENINSFIKSDLTSFIKESDDYYYNQILEIAKDIKKHKDERPIILLSGPSGSGKTTTAFVLEHILDEWGLETHTISMDNYFLPLTKEDFKAITDGTLDLESPNRVDTELLNSQIEDMVQGKTVVIPKYDFKNAKRIEKGLSLTRKPNELVIFEGIHALNPNVITVDENETAKVYVSVKARVEIGEQIVHPSIIRLIRRMIRDKNYRGRSALETLLLYDSVELGEDKYIMPYRDRATYVVDSFISYELGVYKSLIDLDFDVQKYEIAKIIRDLLDEVEVISKKNVPEKSLIREFIGNGHFKY